MEDNHELQLAWKFIESTGTNLFLTGKAGTGKTTFLRRLKEKSPKRMVVVAPTGIAAINAGGVTIHSFFQLSFAPHIPDTTLQSAKAFYKFGREKLNIIRSMDLLVIDEISMVRADLLDAIDSVLRRYRNRHKPFGGVQLLMIGDLQQLAPVVRDEEWKLLSEHYDTLFFFGSHSLKETAYITIELTKVYRQTDERFVGLLNMIRSNKLDAAALAELNQRYLPNFRPTEEEGYIRLTTHNYQAQRHNEQELAALPDRVFKFKAQIDGVFPESAYVADEVLAIKPGAQIMFIKNDTSAEKRFYNGKIGHVVKVSKDTISVRAKGDDTPFVVERAEWTNSKYSLNPVTKEITEEIEGTFKQYPIRLAWAITVHKSQGLTFERAIIDANASFAHGQVYVALSRCKTLEGMVLSSPLNADAIISNEEIDEFNRIAEAARPDEERLRVLEKDYFYELLCEQFSFKRIEQFYAQVLRLLDEHLYRLYPKLLERYKFADMQLKSKISKVADTFQVQYSSLLAETNDYTQLDMLHQRIKSGAHYFRIQLAEVLLPLLADTKIETDNKVLKKRYLDAMNGLRESVQVKQGTLLSTEKNGFAVSTYLKQKAVVMLSFEEEKATPKGRGGSNASSRSSRAGRQQKIEVPSDVANPTLYKEIIAWRNAEAAKKGMPVYTVIQQKAILGIVNLLPIDIDALLTIPYFGKKSAEKYGDQLLDMIKKHAK